ncbi:Uncharacterized protein PHSC3_001639 [Chlamydiales bacterium STE3]|nr:Uncharacterized protein PHSC3_001639 [Chlamydiales bacterium STE3]
MSKPFNISRKNKKYEMDLILKQLQEWYAQQCDGDWEHAQKITITTIDNPGWSIKINLEGTELEDKPFIKIFDDRSDDDWVFCNVANNQFQVYGGTGNLMEMLQIFINWAESTEEN